MVQKAPIISGIISFSIGAIFLLNSLLGITGFVIFDDVEKSIGSFVGVAFIFFGLLLLASARDDDE